MNVLIVGATGYVGTSVDEALVARGHRTVGTARSDAARSVLEARGTAVASADAAKPNTLTSAVRSADAVVYAVTVTDANSWNVDVNALRAIRKALAGTEKTFAYISGAWVYGSTGDVPATENAPLQPPPLVARRIELERETLGMTQLGIRALVIRPGIAYGRGAGIPAMFVQSARERGAATIVGEGTNRWATIHIADLGMLVALALESGRPGRSYNAAGDDRFHVSEIAEAASRGAGAGGATINVDPEIIGQYGECLALDQIISADRAKSDLGWTPQAPSIVEDLEHGSYSVPSVAV
ncbi:MAG: NAD-dependent epimerase/dehydratase family protein [Candidatus Eremiobacteraeota bacterium]|nr:NAD-dependent epimerase/dehydratase family protein [Candidatus Eremiobacteraeota bacterium]